MINEFHYVEVICDCCGASERVEVTSNEINRSNLISLAPKGWFAVCRNIDNLRCPTCAAKEYEAIQPKIGDVVTALINDKQRNLKTLHKYVVDDVCNTNLINDKYYKAVYVKTENGGISAMYLGEYTM